MNIKKLNFSIAKEIKKLAADKLLCADKYKESKKQLRINHGYDDENCE